MTKRTCVTPDCTVEAQGRGKYCHDHSPRRLRDVPIEQRIMARVQVGSDNECWPWLGVVGPHGYGAFRHDGTGNLRAHRFVYELKVGTIPAGKVLDHICHNRVCVNPHHLRPITPKQNVENFGQRVRVNNTTGFRGVYLHSSGLFAATVTHNLKAHHAGYFKTAAEAGEAARVLRLKLHTHNDLDLTG